MPMIIVSSLEAVEDVFKRYDPAFAISILDSDDDLPESVSALPEDHRIRFGGAECDKADDEACWCPEILTIAERWAATDKNIVVHCHRGVARSMAIAFILMCVKEKGSCEYKIAERLREAAPHADPNLLLVSKADEELRREDRMVSAVLDLCPCCSTVAAPVVTLRVD
jgi:predicted protein tyrosine phosphatase